MAGDPTRSGTRVPVKLPMLFDTGDTIGDGCISNISDTGALIECADKDKPTPGASLLLAIKVGSAHLRIHASVARLTETGFAVAFVDLGRTGREVLDVLLRPSPVVERTR